MSDGRKNSGPFTEKKRMLGTSGDNHPKTGGETFLQLEKKKKKMTYSSFTHIAKQNSDILQTNDTMEMIDIGRKCHSSQGNYKLVRISGIESPKKKDITTLYEGNAQAPFSKAKAGPSRKCHGAFLIAKNSSGF